MIIQNSRSLAYNLFEPFADNKVNKVSDCADSVFRIHCCRPPPFPLLFSFLGWFLPLGSPGPAAGEETLVGRTPGLPLQRSVDAFVP
jgi:hypothetical protein